ncbi:Ribonuclease P protein component, mitochondrial [Wickerhamomyces ciferrii]|uniref:Ribonuclease P protein component, mitochondrial n=1 Tax=Wickerhamomyces ciferrii (strain ATCC 14091 / BCRC 22168 / CBS 111 / JCM 3599 / NBRC 0793 / NRRL Y-1031 F-60-10) TaxID=1206466 RepID=K0KVB8_WICCF|nr:Ribonuclease P protein component, mitochondrial [Wickerhamomyces ciferrii]CCH45384.1 Ribonuclease P protein component, mitochondrial [Wickerhamomyces ciferrii]
MPFKCFNNNFYHSSKRYHTAAKQNATAFFDSSFNYIRQNSHLVSLESLSNGARNYPNPHPANSTTTNYLQFDYNGGNNILVNDDENQSGGIGVKSSTTLINEELERRHNRHQNPITFILPYQLDQVALALNKSSRQQNLQKITPVNISNALHTTRSHRFEQRSQFHTSSSTLQTQYNIAFNDQHQTSPTLVEEKIKELDSKKPILQSPDQYNELIPEEQNDETFLTQQTNQILEANDSYQYEKIHSLYMAIKRNNIIPSRELYAIVLSSIVERKIDDSLDDKLSTLLNVYQDLVSNKIKPDSQIYSIVINKLLSASIESKLNPELSKNGLDFFKIAIDIFNASNCSQIQSFENDILDQILIGMNLYPGIVNPTSLMNFLNNQEHFIKNHIYYISMINYCKLTQNSNDVIELYEEFKTKSIDLELLNEKQFHIYSAFISTLVEINEITLATKFLDKLLTSIKNYSEYDSKLKMLLTSYILSLSKIDIGKAMEIWKQFNKIDWIPEFSYEFYSHLLNDVTTYTDGLKIYNYMIGLPKGKPSNESKLELDMILIKPRFIDSISRFILSAIQSNDKTHTLKAIKESFIRKSYFDFQVYPIIFQYLSNDELTTKIINSHGLSMPLESSFEFLSYLTSIPNNLNLNFEEISKTEFFQKLINNFKLYDQNTKNYMGFYSIYNSIFSKNLNNESSSSIELLEICSPLIIEFHDLDNYYTELNQETLVFKNQLTAFYSNLIEILQLNESSNVSPITKEALILMNQI